MSEDDQAYFSRRAEEEISRAQASHHEAAVSAHYRLAGYYLDRVFGPGPEPGELLVSSR
ncbi:hypothetical protein [Allosphingosinicella deserti]|uniref:hypothetical protein n=1 Tax=Allosphingosinicella deserti TaxID=2116704 RepID=UPI0018ED3E84|nr:hypothetical protein [Sphingomonas deserti]